jgi:general secretion pathway protein I
MRRTAKRSAGFTLLEVMVAVAILAVSLMALSLTMIRSVRASQHARLMTQATFLCRLKFGDLENGFVVDGFTDDAGIVEKKGEFDDPLFKNFHWSYAIQKIELPSADKIQTAATKLLQDKQKTSESAAAEVGGPRANAGSSSASSGLSGGMGSFLGPVKQMLEQGIRRVTMRVLWNEPGLPEQKVEVVTFYTDMRRIPLGPISAPTAPSTTTSTTTKTTTTTGTTK